MSCSPTSAAARRPTTSIGPPPTVAMYRDLGAAGADLGGLSDFDLLLKIAARAEEIAPAGATAGDPRLSAAAPRVRRRAVLSLRPSGRLRSRGRRPFLFRVPPVAPPPESPSKILRFPPPQFSDEGPMPQSRRDRHAGRSLPQARRRRLYNLIHGAETRPKSLLFNARTVATASCRRTSDTARSANARKAWPIRRAGTRPRGILRQQVSASASPS